MPSYALSLAFLVMYIKYTVEQPLKLEFHGKI